MLPLSPAMKTRLVQQAKAEMSRGRLPQARAALTQLAQADPANPEHPFQLSRIAFEEGDREACVSHLRRAVALAPNHAQLTQHAADRFRHFGLSDDALAAYDRLIAAGGNTLKPEADKAHYLQLLGRFDEAQHFTAVRAQRGQGTLRIRPLLSSGASSRKYIFQSKALPSAKACTLR